MPVLPFPSFLDDVKEKGFRKATYEGINGTVERLTAGMNIRDIRETLRGEEPSRRPNPRLRPHTDSFWLHIRPSYFHRDVTGIFPTFKLGWLAVYFIVLEAITGIFLMIWYTPSPDHAYESMIHILSDVPLGQLMRDLHRLGAEAMVLVVVLHMIRTFITGSYKRPRQFTWFTGVILLILTLFLSFSGYLLPWDQLSLWAVTIGTSVIDAVPPEVVGENLNLLARGGHDIGANGLLRFYLLHVVAVPLVLLIFAVVHYYKVVKHGHSLPPRKEEIGEDTAKRVPLDKRVYFLPDVLTSELIWIGITTVVLLILSLWFFHAPLENHADPLVTPIGTTAPWYFLWIQGALKLGDKMWLGVMFPLLIFVGLMVMPYIDKNPSRRYADRRLMLVLAFLMMSATSVLTYMGTAEYGVDSSADQEILHHLTQEPAHNKVGIIRPIPFSQLVPGMYTTLQFGVDDDDRAIAELNETLNGSQLGMGLRSVLSESYNNIITPDADNFRFRTVPVDAPELDGVLQTFYDEIQYEDRELHNGWGVLIITENQTDLMRVDAIIIWESIELENGVPVLDGEGNVIPVLDNDGGAVYLFSAKHVFVHRDSAYFAN